MPDHHTYSFVFGGLSEKICQSHIHAHSHRVLLDWPIQLNTQDTSYSFSNNVTHRAPPLIVSSKCRTCATAPLARNPSISIASNPNSLRTSSLCSPISGARFADTLVTPCTWIGLLIVEVSLPPAPSSGTTMSFARSWGSLITSSGPRTGPNVAWTPLKTSDQCAIGCAPKTSSRMAVSWGMFTISFAGSENRGSVRRSGRPMAFATAATLSGVTRRTNQVPSAARYTFSAAFAGFLRSCSPKNFAPLSAAWIETLADQIPSASSEVVTY